MRGTDGSGWILQALLWAVIAFAAISLGLGASALISYCVL